MSDCSLGGDHIGSLVPQLLVEIETKREELADLRAELEIVRAERDTAVAEASRVRCI